MQMLLSSPPAPSAEAVWVTPSGCPAPPLALGTNFKLSASAVPFVPALPGLPAQNAVESASIVKKVQHDPYSACVLANDSGPVSQREEDDGPFWMGVVPLASPSSTGDQVVGESIPALQDWSDLLESAMDGLGTVTLISEAERALLKILEANPYHGSGCAPNYDSIAALCAVTDVAHNVMEFLPRCDIWAARMISPPMLRSVNTFVTREIVDLLLRPFMRGAQCLTVLNVQDVINKATSVGPQGKCRRTPQVLVRQAIVATRSDPRSQAPMCELRKDWKEAETEICAEERANLALNIFSGLAQERNVSAFHRRFRLVLWPRYCPLLKLLLSWMPNDECVGLYRKDLQLPLAQELQRRYVLLSPDLANPFIALENVVRLGLTNGGRSCPSRPGPEFPRESDDDEGNSQQVISLDRLKEFASHFSAEEAVVARQRFLAYSEPLGAYEFIVGGSAELWVGTAEMITSSLRFKLGADTLRHLSVTGVSRVRSLSLVDFPVLQTFAMDLEGGTRTEDASKKAVKMEGDASAPTAGGTHHGTDHVADLVLAANFGKGCPELQYVRLPGNLCRIKENAFADCPKLVEIDLSNCTHLTRISGRDSPQDWNYRSTRLGGASGGCGATRLILPSCLQELGDSSPNLPYITTLDLSHTQVTTLHEKFCLGCERLQSVKLPVEVTKLPSGSFSNSGPMPRSECGCPHCLVELDLSTATALTSVGDSVCSQRRLLGTVKLPSGIMEIGSNFCQGAFHLQVLDLSHCSHLTKIGWNFGANCPELREVRLPSSVQEIKSEFCEGCPNLERVFIQAPQGSSGPPQLQSIGRRFCAECPALQVVDLSAGVSMGPQGGDLKIGSEFCSQCDQLRHVYLPVQTRTIGDRFCYRNLSMTEVDFSATQLSTVGDRFVAECAAMTKIQLPTTVTSTGSGFMQYCTQLKGLDLRHTRLSEIGTGFARGCKLLDALNLLLPLTRHPSEQTREQTEEKSSGDDALVENGEVKEPPRPDFPMTVQWGEPTTDFYRSGEDTVITSYYKYVFLGDYRRTFFDGWSTRRVPVLGAEKLPPPPNR